MPLVSPVLMGILNVTPDSFFDGGRYHTAEEIRQKVGQMLEDGAGIIDIGGYSSRPGAVHISTKEEITRVGKCLGIVKKWFPDCVVSVDTFRSDVAEMALKHYGAALINDISGGDLDAKMMEVVARHKAAYVLMHMQGTPQNMQQKPAYRNVVTEVIKALQAKIVMLEAAGVNDVIVDPGFGFGKSIPHNYALLTQLKMFNLLQKPVLVGISRKSMLHKPLGISAADSLNVTTSGHVLALLGGADILRVHDVKAARECIHIVKLAKTSN